jgi:hypothetical protein
LTLKPKEISPRSKDSIETVISEHGKSLAKESGPPKQLEERLDKVELLIEEMGQKAELVTNFNDYVTDLRNDLESIRRTRFWLVILGIMFIGAIDLTLVFMMAHEKFWSQDTYFKSVSFIGVLTGSVVLLSIMLKGAFHALAERKKDNMIPDHMKEGLDALKLLIGK